MSKRECCFCSALRTLSLISSPTGKQANKSFSPAEVEGSVDYQCTHSKLCRPGWKSAQPMISNGDLHACHLLVFVAQSDISSMLKFSLSFIETEDSPGREKRRHWACPVSLQSLSRLIVCQCPMIGHHQYV